jgi:hypothetical protein
VVDADRKGHEIERDGERLVDARAASAPHGRQWHLCQSSKLLVADADRACAQESLLGSMKCRMR